MNSVAKDVTIFTDESVVCAGPIVPGPALDEWVVGPGREVLIHAGLAERGGIVHPAGLRQPRAPVAVPVLGFRSGGDVTAAVGHRRRPSAAGGVGRRRLERHVDAGAESRGQTAGRLRRTAPALEADLVVLAQGYLDRTPTAAEAGFAAAADFNDLTYIPPGYTADVDLSGLRAGSSVLVQRFRAGVHRPDGARGAAARWPVPRDGPDGGLTYQPSGHEPILYVGSRRGVPYHAKLGYSLESAAPVPPVHFTRAAVEAISKPGEPADFRSQLWPLIVKELADAHYRRLFEFHRDRTVGPMVRVLPGAEPARRQGSRVPGRRVGGRPGPGGSLRSRLHRPALAWAVPSPIVMSCPARWSDYVTDDLARRADPNHSLGPCGVQRAADRLRRAGLGHRLRPGERPGPRPGLRRRIPRAVLVPGQRSAAASAGGDARPARGRVGPVRRARSRGDRRERALRRQIPSGAGRDRGRRAGRGPVTPARRACCIRPDDQLAAGSRATGGGGSGCRGRNRASAAANCWPTPAVVPSKPTAVCTRRDSCWGRRYPARPVRPGSPGPVSMARVFDRTTQSPGSC